jgi:hypothetical protein
MSVSRTAARVAFAALVAALGASCAPSSVPPLRSPASVEAFCGSKQARNTGIASVLTSTDDRVLGETPSAEEIRRAVRSGDGVIAHWHSQELALPRVAQALGESDGYARVDAAAIPPAPDGAQIRHIYLEVRDHGTDRWITMNAYDMQNVCVEGKRES